VVARDRLAQKVKCVTHRAPSGSSGALSDLGVWRMVRPSESGNLIFADKRREWQILRKGVGAEG
jgi:hypothetical protein